MDKDYAERARALVGTRFRPQGRAPEMGLDCVGLVLVVFGLPVEEVRRDYRLRGDHREEMLAVFARRFRRVTAKQRKLGDVLLLQVAPEQMHLAIVTEAGFVHADARRGKVVETSGMPSWPLLAIFRRRVRNQESM